MSWKVIDFEGKRHRVAVAPTQDGAWIGFEGGSIFVQKADVMAEAGETDDAVRAPMTGKIVDVKVEVEQEVEEGALLVVMEAMKMEYRLTAPHAGRVESVDCEAGQLVDMGATLVVLAE
ncbi:hypothetical protein KAI87_09620 [Myxococcota bacterium]|nr:hypothetical protein [Myxococcota bacterium]